MNRLRAAAAVLLLAVPAAARPSVKALIRRFGAASGDERLRLAAALGRTREKAAVDALLLAFDVPHGSPREMSAIADALGAAGDARAAPELAAADEYLRSIAPKLGGLTAPLQVLRRSILDAAGLCGGEASVHLLKSALNDPDPRVAASAERGLGRLQVKDAAAALERFAAGGGERAQAAFEALADLGDKSAAGALAPALSTGDALTRIESAYALARLGRDGMVERLDAALSSGAQAGGGAPLLAAYYLCRLDRSTGLAYLDGLMRRDDSGDAVLAAEALGKSGNPRAVLPLCDAASSSDSDLRAAAARALGRLGGERAISTLKTMRSDQNPVARSAALSSLAELGVLD